MRPSSGGEEGAGRTAAGNLVTGRTQPRMQVYIEILKTACSAMLRSVGVALKLLAAGRTLQWILSCP